VTLREFLERRRRAKEVQPLVRAEIEKRLEALRKAREQREGCEVGLRRRALLVGLFLLATSCGRESAAPDNEFTLEKLKPGRSTKTDVLAMTGEPDIREVLPDGTEMWAYLWFGGKGQGHGRGIPF
jgi:hypothetical protein